MGIALENATALYLTAIRDGKCEEAADKFIGDRYIQHSTPVKDGKDGFVEFFKDFLKRNPIREIEVIRSFQDGNFVFLHVSQLLNNGEYRYVTADILEADEAGKMIEHWDVIAECGDPNPSGRTQLDGPTEPVDLEKTDANKALVTAFLKDVLQGGQTDKLTDFVSTETYIQHNPLVADGLDGLGAFMEKLASEGKSMKYEEVHKVVGCGSFVASLCKVSIGEQELAVVDLFRVDSGKIVEHWDVMEDIPPKEKWVNSGKF